MIDRKLFVCTQYYRFIESTEMTNINEQRAVLLSKAIFSRQSQDGSKRIGDTVVDGAISFEELLFSI